ncbi:MAG: amidohydrolase family protein [Gammaproteobacteria bacterium]|nr:amidohydrolase family protein [Gammaproteobacteria bacterium]MDE0368034.1 amidohydrolase family protein [Gammaproteobacteria bacterium]
MRWPAALIPVILIAAAVLGGCASNFPLTAFVEESTRCYDRDRQPQTAVVDAHLHFRPFGGPALPFEEVVSYLERSGVRFVTAMGIGQTLPADSSCTYYLRCPGTPVQPTLRNDIANADAFVSRSRPGVHIVLSMTFPDLARPESVLRGMRLLDREYPGAFGWMGEVNLVKQALFGNGHEPVAESTLAGWGAFMEVLRARNIPLAVHADLGNDEEPTAYLHLIEQMLAAYPGNAIIWMHMGLSRELVSIDPQQHIEVLKSLLDRHPRLMIDLSWRVIDEHYFAEPDIRAHYVPFLNEYSERVLPGTDFVASHRQTYEKYRDDLRVTSRIYGYLDDTAFRNIALGQNYFDLLGLDYRAPPVCNRRS